MTGTQTFRIRVLKNMRCNERSWREILLKRSVIVGRLIRGWIQRQDRLVLDRAVWSRFSANSVDNIEQYLVGNVNVNVSCP